MKESKLYSTLSSPILDKASITSYGSVYIPEEIALKVDNESDNLNVIICLLFNPYFTITHLNVQFKITFNVFRLNKL